MKPQNDTSVPPRLSYYRLPFSREFHRSHTLKKAKGRRAFLQSGLVGGLAAAVAPAMRVEVIEARKRPAKLPEVPPFALEEITISELQEGMKSGKYTARGITEKYLARIDAGDNHAPDVKHLNDMNTQTLQNADAFHEERSDKSTPGAQHSASVQIV